jgi:hypothetical protein
MADTDIAMQLEPLPADEGFDRQSEGSELNALPVRSMSIDPRHLFAIETIKGVAEAIRKTLAARGGLAVMMRLMFEAVETKLKILLKVSLLPLFSRLSN